MIHSYTFIELKKKTICYLCNNEYNSTDLFYHKKICMKKLSRKIKPKFINKENKKKYNSLRLNIELPIRKKKKII